MLAMLAMLALVVAAGHLVKVRIATARRLWLLAIRGGALLRWD